MEKQKAIMSFFLSKDKVSECHSGNVLRCYQNATQSDQEHTLYYFVYLQ